MITDLTAIVPVRKGSQRVKNKNMKSFCGSNLLEIKLECLKKVPSINKIVVSSDCTDMLAIAKSLGVETHRREDYFASSECTNSEFFENLAQSVEMENVLYCPVTSPLISRETYSEIINLFKTKNISNIVTTSLVKHHLWLDGKPLNYDIKKSPNSQDLPNIMALNYACNIISRADMIKHKNVVTEDPYFYVLNEIESIDIDTEFDFMMAELIYKKMKNV